MSKQRLRKRELIKSAVVFDEVFSSGKRVSSRNLVLVAKESEKRQLGFAVTRKVRGAVNRNRAKRRLREVVRSSQQALPENLTVVVVAREGATAVKFESLRTEYLQLLDRVVKVSK